MLELSGGLSTLPARMRAPSGRGARGAVAALARLPRPSAAAAYALLVGICLLALALVDDGGRAGAADTGTLFWLPLAAMVTPVAFRLLSARAGVRERLALLVLLAVGLYGVKVLLSPASFTFSDELSTLRTTEDIARTGSLLTPNTLARAFPLYPGIDLAALSLSQVTGLSLFLSGLIVIGTAKLLIVLAVFRLLLTASGSERVASLAALLYMANPNFLFFDAEYCYESLALPLAIGTLALVGMALTSRERARRRGLTALAALTGVAVAPTHHMTSYALLAVLAAWTAALTLRGRRRRPAGGILPAAAVLAALALAVGAWLCVVGASTGGYLQPVLGGAVQSTYSFLTGSGAAKAPFHSSASGEVNSPLEQALGMFSVLILLALLAAGLLRALRRRPPSALAWVLTLMALLYPVSLALRLTQAGAETSNRASEFLFLGLSLVGAGVLAARTRGGRTPRAIVERALASALIAILFMGGVVIGWPPASRVPGRALIEADPRSVEPYDLAAAQWAGAHLPPGGRMVADRANGLLMSAYGGQDPLIGAVEELPFGAIITSPWWGSTEERIIAAAHIEYVVVDRRLAGRLPALGIYVDHDEPLANAHAEPLPARAVTKYARRRDLVRIYDNGEVSIYRILPGAGRRGR